jgi:DNA-binding NtrC family response regulator
MESRKKLVLVIEDEDDLRQEIGQYLQRQGYAVAGCACARAARERLRALIANGEPPYAVLCDETLPDGSGVEIFLDFGADTRGSHWILMSGAHDEEGRLSSAQASGRVGAYSVLEKPFSLKALKTSLD